MRRPVRLRPARRYLLAVFAAAALLLPLERPAAAKKIQIQEIDKPGDLSLLADGHSDRILDAHGPNSSTWSTYFLVLADGNFLVPIERFDGRGDALNPEFLFYRAEHGDCSQADARFFRKIVDGKVAGFYAIQSSSFLDEDNKDFGGLDDFRNATMVYEVFRFERRHSKPAGYHYPRFRKVTEKRVVVQSCDINEMPAHVIELIRNH